VEVTAIAGFLFRRGTSHSFYVIYVLIAFFLSYLICTQIEFICKNNL